ncbi:hypothetical protein JCM8097_006863 [Rhodosporidiobolus ruineniae]
MPTLAPLTVTRDLLHFRKSPARETALPSLISSFLSLLGSPTHPAAASLRSVFLPALTGTDARPRDAGLLGRADEQLRLFFAGEEGQGWPEVVLLQTVPSADQVEAAWRVEDGARMRERIFVSMPLQKELERAKAEGEGEELANLSMMVLATLTYELAHWISVKVRGYRSLDFSDTASLRTTTTGISFTTSLHSVQSSGSGGPLAPPRQSNDVGTRAVLLLLGHDYELLTFTLGTRQLVKRRFPTRRSPVLTPPVVFFLIGDTPSIVDATAWPPTYAGMVPPLEGKEGDSMYAVTSVLTPAGVAKMHGECLLVEAGGAPSSVGTGPNASQVRISLTGPQGDEDDEDEKMVDPIYHRGGL